MDRTPAALAICMSNTASPIITVSSGPTPQASMAE
jgi:hypothetical protein